MTERFEVLVQLVMAAITTEPWVSSARCPLSATTALLGRGSTGAASAGGGVVSPATVDSQSMRSFALRPEGNCSPNACSRLFLTSARGFRPGGDGERQKSARRLGGWRVNKWLTSGPGLQF